MYEVCMFWIAAAACDFYDDFASPEHQDWFDRLVDYDNSLDPTWEKFQYWLNHLAV
jgi:hypothetical protein